MKGFFSVSILLLFVIGKATCPIGPEFMRTQKKLHSGNLTNLNVKPSEMTRHIRVLQIIKLYINSTVTL